MKNELALLLLLLMPLLVLLQPGHLRWQLLLLGVCVQRGRGSLQLLLLLLLLLQRILHKSGSCCLQLLGIQERGAELGGCWRCGGLEARAVGAVCMAMVHRRAPGLREG